jgi:hypothetical protein
MLGTRIGERSEACVPHIPGVLSARGICLATEIGPGGGLTPDKFGKPGKPWTDGTFPNSCLAPAFGVCT